MTSPITNLKKTNLASEKIINNELAFRNKGPMPIETGVYYVRRNSPSDLMVKENIILNMSNRLANLESEMAGVRHELNKAIEVINRKDAEIAMLKEQLIQQGTQPVQTFAPVADKRVNRRYQEYDDGYIENSDRRYYHRPNIDWEEKYYEVSDRLAEMEKFLADYGLIWVGDKKSAGGQDSIIQTAVNFVPDFDKVIAIIGELNARASSESHIKVVGNEARFQKADILNLTFYNDGMELENNNFRKYSTESALTFFRDLEDGYYPTELKESYPEGVIFKVTDKRSMPYEMPKKEESIFSGPGYRLGTQVPSKAEPNQIQVHFQFDTDAKKNSFQNVFLTKNTLGLDNVRTYVTEKIREEKGSTLKRFYPKKILKEYKGSNDKLTKKRRDQRHVVFEKSTNNFKNKGGRYYVPVESQSVPVLRRNVNEQYYPTEYPQQNRAYKEQEYREYANNKQQEYKEYADRERGREMNYDIASAASPDSISMNTVYDNSYSRADHKKKIYDATSELVQSETQKKPEPNYDYRKNYENFVVIGKQGNAEEEKGERKMSDENSKNIKNIKNPITEHAEGNEDIRKSIEDPDELWNTHNGDLDHEGRRLSEINGVNDRKSFSEGQASKRPSSDESSEGQEKPNMKLKNASRDNEDRRKNDQKGAEYEINYNSNAEDVSGVIEKRSSPSPRSITNEEAEVPKSKLKGKNMDVAVISPPEAKAPKKNVLSTDKPSDKSNMQSSYEYEEQESREKKRNGTKYNEPSDVKLDDKESYDKVKKIQSPNQDEDQEMQNNSKVKKIRKSPPKEKYVNNNINVDIFNEPSGLRPGDMDSYDKDRKNRKLNQQEQEMQNNIKARNDPYDADQVFEEKAYKQDMIPSNNKNLENEVQPIRTPSDEIEMQESEEMLTTEYDNAYNSHNPLKPQGLELTTFQRRNDPYDEKLFKGKTANKFNIVPSNKRSAGDEMEEDSRSDSPMNTEYGDAYGTDLEDSAFLDLKNKPIGIKRNVGHGQLVIINSNKESKDFVLGNEKNNIPLTSEYRDAFGAKFKYVFHQCSANIDREAMMDHRDRSIDPNVLKLFSKGKVYEPKIIPLNNKTSDGQIELNMKSYNGNEIYSAYLYPDDSISKVWSLTELSHEDFVVTVDNKVLHINVPLKYYNINGDVTLNISKRKSSFLIKEVGAYKSKSYNNVRDVYCSADEDYFSDRVDNEEGYSS